MLNTTKILQLVLISAILLLSFPSLADKYPPGAREAYKEIPDDPYIASPRSEHERSPALRVFRDSHFTVQVNVDAFGQNIVGDAANEPSIAVDGTNPGNIVIGWRQFDTIASNFRQAGYGYTTDAGLTWTFPGVIDPGVFRSDPVLDSDSAGRIYYNSLTLDGGDYVCDVFGSINGGMSWDGGTSAHGGDKQWMTIDKSGGPGDGHLYAFWNISWTSCAPGFFTRSTNENASYENCTSIPDDPYWGTLTVAPDGQLYTIGAHGGDFVVGRSPTAQYAGQAVTWNQSTVVDLGGEISYFDGPNPAGLLGQAHIAAVPSAGPLGYSLCALCSVDPPGSDPLEIRFSRSMDGGATWSAPVTVNDDTGNAWQWFGTMSTSASGRIDVVWLDTRDDPGGYDSSLYCSYSEDGGLTWSANERLSESFDPHLGWPNQDKMGDYFHMVSDELGFNLAWAATLNGEQDVYFTRKVVEDLTAVDDSPLFESGLLRADANPFTGSTTIRYQIPEGADVSLKVYDILGREVATLAAGAHAEGSYRARLDGRNLPGGVYFCRLSSGEHRDAMKLLLLK